MKKNGDNRENLGSSWRSSDRPNPLCRNHRERGKREEFAAQRKLNAHSPAPERRPDKKQRRDIIKFKNQ